MTGGYRDGKRGFFEVVKYGSKLRTLVNVKSLMPTGIWVLKRNVSDKHHTYIITSMASRKTTVYVSDNSKLVVTNELKLDTTFE